jgi:predicted metal-dependent hydrolase
MDPRLADAVELFNRREYFASQEELEQLWRASEGDDKKLLESLVQLSVALHLFFHRGGGKGTTGLLQRCLLGLEDVPPTQLGIDVKALSEEVAVYLEDLRKSDVRTPRLLERWRVPKLRLA